jgi:hypothetical protein
MTPARTSKPEVACICGARFPMGTDRCDCGSATYPVGSDPWAKPAEQEAA